MPRGKKGTGKGPAKDNSPTDAVTPGPSTQSTQVGSFTTDAIEQLLSAFVADSKRLLNHTDAQTATIRAEVNALRSTMQNMRAGMETGSAAGPSKSTDAGNPPNKQTQPSDTENEHVPEALSPEEGAVRLPQRPSTRVQDRSIIYRLHAAELTALVLIFLIFCSMVLGITRQLQIERARVRYLEPFVPIDLKKGWKQNPLYNYTLPDGATVASVGNRFV